MDLAMVIPTRDPRWKTADGKQQVLEKSVAVLLRTQTDLGKFDLFDFALRQHVAPETYHQVQEELTAIRGRIVALQGLLEKLGDLT